MRWPRGGSCGATMTRHYDGHDSMAEKRKALETLCRLLEYRSPVSKRTPTHKALRREKELA